MRWFDSFKGLKRSNALLNGHKGKPRKYLKEVNLPRKNTHKRKPTVCTGHHEIPQDGGNTRASHVIQQPVQLKSLADAADEPKRCKPNYLHQRQCSIQCGNKADVVGVEKDLTQCLGKGRERGVFQGKSFHHPLAEQSHSPLACG